MFALFGVCPYYESIMIFFIHRETMGLIYLLVAMNSLPPSHAQRQKKREKNIRDFCFSR